MLQDDRANRRGSGNVSLVSGVIHRRRGPPRALVSVRGQVPAKKLNKVSETAAAGPRGRLRELN